MWPLGRLPLKGPVYTIEAQTMTEIKWQKPVRKCNDCELNLGDRCAFFESPRDKWHGGRCSAYNNPEWIRKFEEERAKHPPKESKEKRKLSARERGTEEHHQGKTRADRSTYR